MQKHNVGSIPVCDKTGVIGMITDRDIVVRNIAHGTDPHTTPVRNVMTSKVTTVTPDTDVDKVSGVMSANQVRRIPVVEDNMLVGIVALGDIATNSRFDIESFRGSERNFKAFEACKNVNAVPVARPPLHVGKEVF